MNEHDVRNLFEYFERTISVLERIAVALELETAEAVTEPPFAEHLGEVFRATLAMARLSAASSATTGTINPCLELDVIRSFTEKHKRAP